MGSALYHLRRLFGGSFQLLYGNGAQSPPVHYHHRCDAVQLLTKDTCDEARAYGVSEEKAFLVPYAIDAGVFRPMPCESRARLRAELGVPSEAFVVLCVAAIKRDHKRIDY